MSDPRPESSTAIAARLLRAMADEVEKNDAARFGGCFLVIPPEGDHKDLLMLSATQPLAMFWGNLKVMAEIALSEIDSASRQNNAFGTRR